MVPVSEFLSRCLNILLSNFSSNRGFLSLKVSSSKIYNKIYKN